MSSEIGRVFLGRRYRFHAPPLIGGRMLSTQGMAYRTVAFARHGVTHQTNVVYEGLEGPDKGALVVCSLNNFLIHFTPDEGAEVGRELPYAVPLSQASPAEAACGEEVLP